MSGLVLNQDVVDVKISFNGGSSFIPFPCVSAAELGELSVDRIKTTAFSSPPGGPEYAQGEVDIGEGSVTYNLDMANNAHRVLLANQGSKDPIHLQITLFDGQTNYILTRAFLNMGISEPFNIGEVQACTLKVQATGPATRSFIPIIP